ncbi:MAG TPA: DNA (cytosine-5-)-methyltransferase, partial [Clostridiales bacterium]|nr:DNA (cytosine-5-)-methyltransferase [Clostridiales bacterium]
APSLSKKNMQRIRASIPNGTWRDWPEELVLPCHKKKGGATYSSVYGRMSWKGLAPTITTQFICYGTGRFGHPEQDRAISLREGALIQSFPANYVFYDPSTEFNQRSIAKHIGNAVPPRLGEIVGESIILSLPKKRKDKKHV